MSLSMLRSSGRSAGCMGMPTGAGTESNSEEEAEEVASCLAAPDGCPRGRGRGRSRPGETRCRASRKGRSIESRVEPTLVIAPKRGDQAWESPTAQLAGARPVPEGVRSGRLLPPHG